MMMSPWAASYYNDAERRRGKGARLAI